MTRNWRVTLPELNEVQISLILRELEAAYQRGYADGAQDTEVRVALKYAAQLANTEQRHMIEMATITREEKT